MWLVWIIKLTFQRIHRAGPLQGSEVVPLNGNFLFLGLIFQNKEIMSMILPLCFLLACDTMASWISWPFQVAWVVSKAITEPLSVENLESWGMDAEVLCLCLGLGHITSVFQGRVSFPIEYFEHLPSLHSGPVCVLNATDISLNGPSHPPKLMWLFCFYSEEVCGISKQGNRRHRGA